MKRDKFDRPLCQCGTPVHPGYTICYQCKRAYTKELLDAALGHTQNAGFRVLYKMPAKDRQ